MAPDLCGYGAGRRYTYEPAFRRLLRLPELPGDYIRNADVIQHQIGANDALLPGDVSVGNATSWKSEQLANSILGAHTGI